MRIHREGIFYISLFAVLSIISLGLLILTPFTLPFLFISLFFLGWLIFSLQFFRNPPRPITNVIPNGVYSPADGKVVVIEETTETEFFHDKRIQISIFMSPTNVHANRVPISGRVAYKKYHEGKYLVAWHPKSSTENERLTVVFEQEQSSILVRQIAGAMARRIKNYLEVGQRVEQGQEMGFIKFGSRVDVFLPLDTKVKVKIGDKVKGNVDVLGFFA